MILNLLSASVTQQFRETRTDRLSGLKIAKM